VELGALCAWESQLCVSSSPSTSSSSCAPRTDSLNVWKFMWHAHGWLGGYKGGGSCPLVACSLGQYCTHCCHTVYTCVQVCRRRAVWPCAHAHVYVLGVVGGVTVGSRRPDGRFEVPFGVLFDATADIFEVGRTAPPCLCTMPCHRLLHEAGGHVWLVVHNKAWTACLPTLPASLPYLPGHVPTLPPWACVHAHTRTHRRWPAR
jgi:hypothetical protein